MKLRIIHSRNLQDLQLEFNKVMAFLKGLVHGTPQVMTDNVSYFVAVFYEGEFGDLKAEKGGE